MTDAFVARAGLYRTIWRWHFYAGLLVAPVLLTLAITGALYLYKDEIERYWYGDIMTARVGMAQPASEQQAAVLTAYPGARVLRYILPRDEGSVSEFLIETTNGKALSIFVDPSSAQVTGALNTGSRLMSIVRDLHSGSLFGVAANYLVELAACWAFILLVTGLFLWWPRGGKGGVFWPRLGAGRRTLLRDLHAVPAFWNAALIAFLILSGLPWSAFWGVQLASFGTLSTITAPSPNFTEGPVLHEGHQQVDNPDLTWSMRNAPEALAGHHGNGAIGLDGIMAVARAYDIDRPGLRVIFPHRPNGTVMLSYVPDTAQGQRTIDLDPTNGAIIRNVGWNEYSPLARVVEFGVETHVGRQFGEANRLLMLLACFGLVFTIVMGVVMWWSRRPKGQLGAPLIPHGFRPGWGVVTLAAAMGLVFPLAGASMLLVLAGETLFALVRRIDAKPA